MDGWARGCVDGLIRRVNALLTFFPCCFLQKLNLKTPPIMSLVVPEAHQQFQVRFTKQWLLGRMLILDFV